MNTPQYKHIILANGVFPESERALTMLRQAETIICCDGAIDKMLDHGFSPTVIVGDCDSMSSENLKQWNHLICSDKSQEYNDLQKALKYCLKHGLDQVALLGCDGAREDHFIANLSIMATYAQWLNLEMITNFGTFNVIDRTTSFPSEPGQQISVFCKDETLQLSFEGLRYPVDKRSFNFFWEGSLNEALGDCFKIVLHGAGKVLVYRADV